MNPLGEEMTAEGWTALLSDDVEGIDQYYWLHPPSGRAVSVTECRRNQWTGPTHGGREPPSPETPGYAVVARRHDKHGNPYEGTGFWLESYGEAVRLARATRRHILGDGSGRRKGKPAPGAAKGEKL